MQELPVLVLGGTGHYGRLIVDGLHRSGQPVRVLTRNAERARKLLGEGPEVVRGDIEDLPSVLPALEGIRSVVVAISAFHSKLIRRRLWIERDCVLRALRAGRERGLERVVCLSGYDVREDFVEPLGLMEFARPMLDVQKALRESDFDWTVLGCPPSMDMFFAFIRGNAAKGRSKGLKMIVPGGGPPAIPSISARDVGHIAAQAAVRDDLAGRRIRLPGPEALSFAEAAGRIGAVWGVPIHYQPIPLTPLRVAGFLARPFYPYLRFVAMAARLLNHFPPELAEEAVEDHRRLRELFDFEPTLLEVEADARKPMLG